MLTLKKIIEYLRETVKDGLFKTVKLKLIFVVYSGLEKEE